MEYKVLIIDFGSQYTQLIARRVRELNIYCEIYSFDNFPKNILEFSAVILSGSPFSVHSKSAPKIDITKIKGNLPILGICYGAQLLADSYGGKVGKSSSREYGRAKLFIHDNNNLLEGFKNNSQVWMSHGDTINKLPIGSEKLASTEDVENAAFKFNHEYTFAIQFHPEVYHTSLGIKLLENFLVKISKIEQAWTPDSFVKMAIEKIKNKVKKDRVILGLSGGVDSSVAAILVHRAIGDNLICIFVNNGLLRKGEFESVLSQYENMGLNIIGVDKSKLFINNLKAVTDPEEKRKIIGNTFIDVFDEESKKINNAKWLAQGTIYPDVIESQSVNGPSATIKSHHNVGGLPDFMKLKIIEPLRMLFKDEVRRVGKILEIDDAILSRHPFPGPGLGIRILGEVTLEKITLLQEVDSIFINSLKEEGLYNSIWQAGAILLPVQSVGVMGDERTYEKCIVLRAVSSTDGMTADWINLPYEFLQKVSNKIINNVLGVNRVVYDVSSKPPSTIEWE
ncbi:MAG: glutamine-hydrolyzing GMP synthase [Flavobacteriaceae bacterium]|tara:strand:- start:4995 stop:6521 length:1527 start_codon:yes stop_codon:yes gene_type:complete